MSGFRLDETTEINVVHRLQRHGDGFGGVGVGSKDGGVEGVRNCSQGLSMFSH